MNPRELPVYQEKQRILEALEDHQVVVVESPTGSGKTTQLPIIMYESGTAAHGIIGVTQPRRIAAVSVSEFIARQMDTSIPELVGYKMRFEDQTDASTRLKIMTDGILLQEMKADYYLSRYSMIIVDEAHERSLNIDFILGLLKRILDARKDFRVIVSSATINAEVFAEYYGSCPIVRIETHMYPVQIHYDPPVVEETHKDAHYEAMLYKIGSIVEDHSAKEDPGDILIFLSGEKLIKECIRHLLGLPCRKKFHVLPLYGRLTKEEQERVFPAAPRGKIKIVVATNIAETSLTIEGITLVIDSGLSKLNYYNPRTFTSSLIEGPISKASCNQRKGRAGRTQAGDCYRLYTKQDYSARDLFTKEEIYRTDLSEVVLRMAEIGITDFTSFDFISSPGKEGIIGAVETLRLLDALDGDNRLSTGGKMMVEFPLLPQHSRMIVEAVRSYPSVIDEVITAASFLSTSTPFLLPQGEELEARRAHHSFQDKQGDFTTYLNLLTTYKRQKKKETFCQRKYLDDRTMGEIVNIKDQLSQIVSDMGIPIGSGGDIRDFLCAVATGLIQFVCRRTGRSSYQSLTAAKVQIHPSSVLFRSAPEFIVAGEIVRTTRLWARSVSPLRREWITAISPRLAEKLLPAAKFGHDKKGKQRDTSMQISLGGKTFQLQMWKGKKKIAVFPWEDLAEIVRDQDLDVYPQLNSLRGKIQYGKYTIMTGAKIPRIIRAARHFDPRRDIHHSWPRKKNFTAYGTRPELTFHIDVLLKLDRCKKGSNVLGFICLYTDGNGKYWFKVSRNFQQAVSESLASLEALVDDLEVDVDQWVIDKINENYRRLASILEQR